MEPVLQEFQGSSALAIVVAPALAKSKSQAE